MRREENLTRLFCLLDEALPEDTLADIRLYLQYQGAWVRDDFCAMVEAKTRRLASTRPAHRPQGQLIR